MTQGSSKDADPIVSSGWLALLEPPTRAKVLDACTLRRSDRGKVLYRIGDAPDGLYGLISGSIRLDTVQSDHGPTMLNIFHAGSWLGEVEMFSRIPRITTMIVLRPVEYLYLPATALEFVSKASPEMWRALGHLAAEHVSLAVAGLDDLTIRSPSLRIVAVILRLCSARLASNVAEPVTELDVTQAEIAQMSNLSRSVVGQRLDVFEHEGLIDRNYGRLVVRDVNGLRRMLGIG